jgi:glutamine amidotransferase
MKAAIVDYEICNMFSVKHACERVGMKTLITSSIDEIMSADVVILPGVGAFGDAMASLRRMDLIQPLKDIVSQNKLLIGICLGMQLLLSESCEFGSQKGLDIIKGSVKKFVPSVDSRTSKMLKVPQTGWNKILKYQSRLVSDTWGHTPLEGIAEGEYVYFVHSYFAVPDDKNVILTRTIYGDYDFCSGLRWNNIFAFQFHPERSGLVGMKMYRNIFDIATRQNVVKSAQKD